MTNVQAILAIMVVVSMCTNAQPAFKNQEFENWKGAQAKSYANDGERKLRQQIWLNSDNQIQTHNGRQSAGLETFKMVHNAFSDMTSAERQAYLGGIPDEANGKGRGDIMLDMKQARTTTRRVTTTARPTTSRRVTTTARPTTSRRPTTTARPATTVITQSGVDWRNTPGMLQPIKNQGSCGSCWAFAAVAALEAAIFKKTGQSMSLSEQQLVDCTYRSSNRDGCQGGWMGTAYSYLISSIGSDKTSAYPYTSGSTGVWGSTCKTNTLGSTAVGFTPVKGYVQTPSGTEAWLQNAVATIGPVTIGYDVVTSFFSYSSGVYYDPDCSSSSANYQGGHAVVVVGYGTDPALGDYWIMRNSWGTGWGQAGHFLMARNRGNLCGLATYATYPTI